VTAAISAIPDDAWRTIRYPDAIYDEPLRQWISDTEVPKPLSPHSVPATEPAR